MQSNTRKYAMRFPRVNGVCGSLRIQSRADPLHGPRPPPRTGKITRFQAVPTGLTQLRSQPIRGRIFSFQWPVSQTPSTSSSILGLTGNSSYYVQIAYTGSQMDQFGYDSKNEPVAVNLNSGGTDTLPPNTYCHSESTATKVVTGSSFGTLWFVNPWVTATIFDDAFATTLSNHTSFFVALTVTNTQSSTIRITDGNIWLQLVVPQLTGTRGLARVLTLGGPLVGTYNNNDTFTLAGQETDVASNQPVMLIYKINIWSWAADNVLVASDVPSSVAFSGVATVANDHEGLELFLWSIRSGSLREAQLLGSS